LQEVIINENPKDLYVVSENNEFVHLEKEVDVENLNTLYLSIILGKLKEENRSLT